MSTVVNNFLLDSNEMDKIILFGGTFDPVHIGHVTVADFARKKIGAERVIFIPAKQSPHKKTAPKANDFFRFEMLQLAVEGMTDLSVNDCEIERGLPSYTIDTVKYFNDRFPDAKIYWLVGADALSSLHHWHCITELVELCTLSIMYRAGFPIPDMVSLENTLNDEQIKKLEHNVIETPLIDASSTMVRQNIAKGSGITQLVGEKVAQYIKNNLLYL